MKTSLKMRKLTRAKKNRAQERSQTPNTKERRLASIEEEGTISGEI